MEPAEFTGKDEEVLRWKESMGLQQVLNIVAKTRSQVTDRTQLSVTEEEWNLSNDIFVLLKRKTVGEARVMVTCVSRDSGFEAWRLLVGRFEPQAGIKRMREVADLMALQNKRCKNAAETFLLLLEIDRRQKLIAEIGGTPVGEEMLVNVLWMAMDPSTRSHVSRKLGDTQRSHTRR